MNSACTTAIAALCGTNSPINGLALENRAKNHVHTRYGVCKCSRFVARCVELRGLQRMANENGNTNQSGSADIVAAPQGFFQSLSNIFGAILFGLVFIPVACWGLWVNEGRVVKTARALAEEQSLVQAIGWDSVDPTMNGRLVHVSCDVRSQRRFGDETFKLLASFIPVLGSLVSGATALIGATAISIMGSLVIALAWFADRPMISIVVMALGFAIAFGFRSMRLKRKVPLSTEPRPA